MTRSGQRKVRNAFIVGLIIGAIGLTSRLVREGIPHHPTPFGAPMELTTEALTPAAFFAFLAWLSGRRRIRVEVPQEVVFDESEPQWRPAFFGIRHVSRVSRGFHRIGIVLAIPFLFAAVISSVQAYSEIVQLDNGLGEIEVKSKQAEDAGKKEPCTPFQGRKGSADETIAALNAALENKPLLCSLLLTDADLGLRYGHNFGPSLIILMLGVLVYSTVWSIGWIIRGFA